MSTQMLAGATADPRYDAIVVGTGLGGASLAFRLSRAGMRVLALEQGGFLRPPASDVSPKTSYFINDMLGSREVTAGFYGSSYLNWTTLRLTLDVALSKYCDRI
jgi:choline dehydrogenase-like flavoprotein